jgi:hypothetical protein
MFTPVVAHLSPAKRAECGGLLLPFDEIPRLKQRSICHRSVKGRGGNKGVFVTVQ